ncbi:hypothetical protein A9R01_10090, partial ['Osedax' symbiont bacterium Rs2_46_30_T18]
TAGVLSLNLEKFINSSVLYYYFYSVSVVAVNSQQLVQTCTAALLPQPMIIGPCRSTSLLQITPLEPLLAMPYN